MNEMIERCCNAVSPLYAEMQDEWARAAIRENVRTVIKAMGVPTAEDIYACCESTLIGFRDELTEQQIKFICDQVSRKSVWSDDGLNEDGSVATA